ncbi:hypothetical protein [Fodinicurvata sp. EGI_FJ10296]|uniref:anti-sigma factor family protein n=1 Tax=Fodinicurvata sp. EGI_FJ10296 TaxID=3231908 RepID=UPI003453D1C0
MTDASRKISDDELNAYLDGEMAPEQLAYTAYRLSDDPEAMARAEDYRFQGAALRALYDRKLPAETPEHLRRLIYGQPAAEPANASPGKESAAALQGRPGLLSDGDARGGNIRAGKSGAGASRTRWRRYAVAATGTVLLLGASLAGGWIGHARYIQGIYAEAQAQTFMNQAYSAYNLYSPDTASDAISEDRLSSVLTTLAEGLGGASFQPPMSRDSFRLVSSEIIPVEGRVGAVFHYIDDEGRKVSLYVQPNWSEDGRFQNAIERDDIAFQYRAEGMLAYALAAPAGLEGLPGLEAWLGGGE